MAIVVFYLINVTLALGIVIATYLWYPRMLFKATIENGPYEVATASIMLAGGIWLIWRAFKQASKHHWIQYAALGMGLVCILGAGEEISWGQHWLRFEANEFFKAHNHQKETNLHNLIPAVVFSTAINVVIYAFYTLLPIVHWAFPNNPLSKQLETWHVDRFIPSSSIALMMMLASCFHAWLMPETYSDSIVLVTCWLFAAFMMIKNHSKVPSTIDWILLLAAPIGFLICIWCEQVFRYENMQYEIRECFTAFIIVYWCLQWSNPAKLGQPD